ncbi:Retrovirus-related Pol polyprotein from transposon 17.6 [Oopsacas minuta]|uniref:Retrovirus-related Pol polyprotein from transposon 17.6 n=1 Tax=Oopsacas minuta TaxID=111878 RepID=A0AAV7JTR2_9METZ|nr:Retrovirus-related Pol polyprotein from transposon 17.6 [Oopsacas minuta]
MGLIRTCHDCQTSAALPPQPQRELQPIPPPEEPWCHCGIDLICNMSRTVLGFQHNLIIVCYLSKFVIVRPLKTKTSKEILDCLQEIYLSFGVPNILQHEQGTEFSSKEFQEFHKINVNTRRTTAHHPQSNGLVESHNRILKT